MMAEGSRRNLTGLLLFACMLLGGGTAPGLARDHALECLIFLAGIIFLTVPPLGYGRGVRRVVLLASAVAVLPLLPVPASLRQALLPESVLAASMGRIAMLTVDADRTVQSVLYFLSLVVLFLLFGSLRRKDLMVLAPFFWAGVAVNAVAAAVQFAAARGDGPLHGAGFFANQNHFAALLYMAIPLLVASSRAGHAIVVTIGAVVFILIEELVAGSRAGIMLSVLLTALSIALVRDRNRVRPGWPMRSLTLGFAAVLGFMAVFAASGSIRQRDIDSATGRYEFARNTVAGIGRSLPFGYGYGTFPLDYPMFQAPSEIVDRFVNHAHNDYLEAVFEGGLPALAAMLAYFVILGGAAQRARTPNTRAALLSVIAVLVQSAVDYPLRTFAIGAVFAWLNAQIFCEAAERRNRSKNAGSDDAAAAATRQASRKA